MPTCRKKSAVASPALTPGMNSGRRTSERMALGTRSSRMAIDAASPRSVPRSATTTPTSSELRSPGEQRIPPHLDIPGEREGLRSPAISRDGEEEWRHERQIDEEEYEADIQPNKATRSGSLPSRIAPLMPAS